MFDHPGDQATADRRSAGRLSGSDPARIGPYRVLARLGAGGMGVVYHATGPDGHPVAIKVVRAEFADDPEFRRRFAAEVDASRRIVNRCTARVLAADVDGPQPYLVTEFVPGPNLADQVRQRGALPPRALRALAAGLAESLVAIHAAGMVHRDLKPSNVLLDTGGPKVIDFGIASAVDATALTRTGAFLGSPGWMAPEQATEGTGRDPAIDVFSWGLVVAFAALGRSPFGEGRAEAMIYRIVYREPELDGLDPDLADLVGRALAKDPSARPTAAELLHALTARAGAGAGAGAVLDRDWSPAFGDLAGSAPTDRATPSRRPRARRRGLSPLRAAGWLAAAAAVIAVVAGLYLASARLGSTPTAAVPAAQRGTAPAATSRAAVPPATVPAATVAPGTVLTGTVVPGAVLTGTVVPGAVPPAADPATAATEVVLFDPFAPGSAEPRKGLQVTARDQGTCSLSSLTLRPDVFRCFGGENMFDPCFRSSIRDRPILICPEAPWTNRAALFAAVEGLDGEDSPSDELTSEKAGDPLFFTTADGQRCTRFGGATSVLRGLPARFECDGGAIGYGEVDRSRAVWAVKMQAAKGGDLVSRTITRVWM